MLVCAKHNMAKRICCVFLVFLLAISTSIPAYATSVAPPAGSDLIGLEEFLGNAEALVQDAVSKYGNMAYSAAQNCAIVVGSAAFAYASTKGITFAAEKSTETAATLGRYIISEITSMDSEIQRLATSVINNVYTQPDYYTKAKVTYTTRLLNSLDLFLGNYVDAGTIQMNQGLVSQTVISTDILERMTESVYDYYTAFENFGYMYVYDARYLEQSSGGIPYAIYGIPVGVTSVLINPGNNVATFYDSSGNQIAVGSEPFINFSWSRSHVEYSGEGENMVAVRVYGDWDANFWTIFSFSNVSQLGIDWGNLRVLTGTSYADAVGLTVDYPLGLDTSGALDVPLSLENDLSIPYTDAISLGTGDLTLEDVGATTGTSVPSLDLSGILDFLSSILEAIGRVVTAILDLPGRIITGLIEGLKELLIALFVPSDAAVAELQDLVDVKMPVINQLESWVGDLQNVVGNPTQYATQFTVTVDLSKSDGQYSYGNDKINLLPIDWYLPYKAQGDLIIVGVAWLVFLWNLYGRIPAILSAVSNTTITEARIEYNESRRSRKDGG